MSNDGITSGAQTPGLVPGVEARQARDFERVRDHARRYMIAVYGKDVFFRAPETFENVLERWIWAVSADEMKMANECMVEIEKMAAEHKQGRRHK